MWPFLSEGLFVSGGRLRFYASRFSLVELNSSYCALPNPASAQLWVERTPSDFIFHVKTFRLFTGHQTPIEALPPEVGRGFGTDGAGSSSVWDHTTGSLGSGSGSAGRCGALPTAN